MPQVSKRPGRVSWLAARASRGLRLAFGQVSIAVLVLFNLYTLAPAYVSKVIGIAAEDTYVILPPVECRA